MLEAGQAGDWERLAALQQARAPLVYNPQDPNLPAANLELGLATLRRILSLNEAIASLAAAERGQRQAQLQGLRRSRLAARCYGREAQNLSVWPPWRGP